MKHIAQSLAYRLTYKRIDERRLTPIHIHAEKQDISYFNLSTNAIISVRHDGKLYYFRECPRLAARDEYFKNAMNAFFETLDRLGISREHFKQDIPIVLDFSHEAVLTFKAYIQSKSADARFMKTMSRADLVSEKCGFSIWESRTYNQLFFDKFGLCDLPQGTKDIAVYFLWYMRSAAIGYRTLGIARGKDHSFFNAVRALSSRIVAEALELDRMIADARFCVLHIGSEKEIFGLLSDAAPGMRLMDCTVEPDGTLQRELMNLNVLDLITFQADHGPNNYNVCVDKNHCSVCAFDNDNPYTFFPLPVVSRPFAGCAPLVDKNGMVSRPYFDKDLAERINGLDINTLKMRLKPYLNFAQIGTLAYRIKKLNKAIKKTQKSQDRFLLTDIDWNKQTAEHETSGKYGVTYLTKALKLN